MRRFYSRATGSTYLEGIHASTPADAVEISEERYLAVIANPPLSKVRGHDDDGLPVLLDPPPLAVDLEAVERAWRDAELAGLVWLRDRHRDQLEIGAPATLTSEQFAELLVYMQDLRDWPQSEAFPAVEQRPAPPLWIAEQSQ